MLPASARLVGSSRSWAATAGSGAGTPGVCFCRRAGDGSSCDLALDATSSLIVEKPCVEGVGKSGDSLPSSGRRGRMGRRAEALLEKISTSDRTSTQVSLTLTSCDHIPHTIRGPASSWSKECPKMPHCTSLSGRGNSRRQSLIASFCEVAFPLPSFSLDSRRPLRLVDDTEDTTSCRNSQVDLAEQPSVIMMDAGRRVRARGGVGDLPTNCRFRTGSFISKGQFLTRLHISQ